MSERETKAMQQPARMNELAIQYLALAKRLRAEAAAGPDELRPAREVHVEMLLRDASALWGWAWVAANGEGRADFNDVLLATKTRRLHVEQQTSWVAADGR